MGYPHKIDNKLSKFYSRNCFRLSVQSIKYFCHAVSNQNCLAYYVNGWSDGSYTLTQICNLKTSNCFCHWAQTQMDN